MKTFTVPLIEKRLVIYVGNEEWSKYVRATKADGAEAPLYAHEERPANSGMQCGSHVWIENPQYTPTLIHELMHYVDAVFTHIGTDDREFRASVAEWVITSVLEWAGVLKTGKGEKH